MTVQLKPCQVRFACDPESHAAVIDQITNAAALTWRGVPVSVQFALSIDGTLITDATNIANVYFQIHTARNLGPLFVKSMAASTLDLTLTDATWKDGSKQHGTFSLTGVDTQIDLTGIPEFKRTLWWVLHVVMSDGTPITCGTGQWTIEEDGAGNMLPIVPGANWNIRQSQTSGLAQLQSPRTALWHSIGLSDPGDGSPKQLVINQVGEA